MQGNNQDKKPRKSYDQDKKKIKRERRNQQDHLTNVLHLYMRIYDQLQSCEDKCKWQIMNKLTQGIKTDRVTIGKYVDCLEVIVKDNVLSQRQKEIINSHLAELVEMYAGVNEVDWRRVKECIRFDLAVCGTVIDFVEDAARTAISDLVMLCFY